MLHGRHLTHHHCTAASSRACCSCRAVSTQHHPSSLEGRSGGAAWQFPCHSHLAVCSWNEGRWAGLVPSSHCLCAAGCLRPCFWRVCGSWLNCPVLIQLKDGRRAGPAGQGKADEAPVALQWKLCGSPLLHSSAPAIVGAYLGTERCCVLVRPPGGTCSGADMAIPLGTLRL